MRNLLIFGPGIAWISWMVLVDDTSARISSVAFLIRSCALVGGAVVFALRSFAALRSAVVPSLIVSLHLR